jgi:hypothetical protein
VSAREVTLSDGGYLILPATLAREHFPHDTLLALLRGTELWLLPTRGAGGGGLLLKQRNPQGDRSVLVREVLADRPVAGCLPAFWDAAQGALRVALVGVAHAAGAATAGAAGA